MINAGVLALQGSVAEHIAKLNEIEGVKPIKVKTREDIERVDGIILPGGESTTLGKLLKDFELFELLKEKIENGLPVWGTCAGMILLASEIVGEASHFGLMDIRVQRNAFGRQIDSFSKKVIIPAISIDPVELIFIRAPWIEKAGNSVEILCSVDDHIVAARQNHMLVTSFHPELTQSLVFHRYFISTIKDD
jgi:5'-phosphate synthase pdxT subunit